MRTLIASTSLIGGGLGMYFSTQCHDLHKLCALLSIYTYLSCTGIVEEVPSTSAVVLSIFDRDDG